MKTPLFFPRIHALTRDVAPSSLIMCDGGVLTKPRLMAPVRTSWLCGITWSTRTCGKRSARMSRSSTSLRSRFLIPFLLTLWAVWLSRLGSEKTTGRCYSQYIRINVQTRYNIYFSTWKWLWRQQQQLCEFRIILAQLQLPLNKSLKFFPTQPEQTH